MKKIDFAKQFHKSKKPSSLFEWVVGAILLLILILLLSNISGTDCFDIVDNVCVYK